MGDSQAMGLRKTLLACVTALAAGCVLLPPQIAENQIRAGELHLPEGARAGMFVTWRDTTTDPGEKDEVEETTACVEEGADHLTMEWRVLRRDGSRTVTAARFARDGRLLGAWRGAPGGVGSRLEIIGGNEIEAYQRRANELEKSAGVSPKDFKDTTLDGRETVQTPAGAFRCVFTETKSSLLFLKMSWKADWSEKPLPLSSMVRWIMTMSPGDLCKESVLVAYGDQGARPTLRIPSAR